ncbi:MAG TPA: RecX family transcriptional regulator [Polyangiaceae bacterium]|nr:RecX family transcriptional regulator [Polyangiaceae bacterium]
MARERARREGAPSERGSEKRSGRRPAERVPVTEAALSAAALRYLDRYDAPREKLVRHLERWIRTRGEPADPARARPLIEALVARYTASGILDEDRLADTSLERLRSRGSSRLAVRAKLAARGVEAGAIDRALEREKAEEPEAELEAARAFSRRRRLGPHRPESERAENRRRDLAALARAGFSFDIARRVLGEGEGDDEF